MKKAIALLSLTLMLGVNAVDAQRPTASKTIQSTRLSEISETEDTFESFALEAGYEMLVTPLVASIQVLSKTADGRYEHRSFEGTNRGDGKYGKEYLVRKQMQGKHSFIDFEMLKAQVVFDFCRETGADVIVMPQFSARHKTRTVNGSDAEGNPIKIEEPIEENGSYVILVEMVGFPAVYTGFRDATENDRWIKRMFNEGKVNNAEAAYYIENELTTKQK